MPDASVCFPREGPSRDPGDLSAQKEGRGLAFSWKWSTESEPHKASVELRGGGCRGGWHQASPHPPPHSSCTESRFIKTNLCILVKPVCIPGNGLSNQLRPSCGQRGPAGDSPCLCAEQQPGLRPGDRGRGAQGASPATPLCLLKPAGSCVPIPKE